MGLYIRFTDTPKQDLQRNESYHLAGDICYEGCEWNDYLKCFAQPLGGLCAYALDAETIEDAIEEAATFKKDIFNAENDCDGYCIMIGEYVGDCPEGDVISASEIVFIKKGDYYKED